MKKTTLRLVVAAACAGVAGGECEVSEWSDWGSCEAFVCQRCDYADAEPGSWTRASGLAESSAMSSS